MTQITKEDVRAALRQVREMEGPEEVAKLLKSIAGVDRFEQIPQSHFAAVLKAAKAGGAAVAAISTRDRLTANAFAYWDSKKAKTDAGAE